MTSPDRPQPLRDVARDVSLTTAVVGAIATALVSFGVFNVSQGAALAGLLSLLPGVAAGITGFWAASRTAQLGAAHVTPIIDPQDAAGRKLVPETGRHQL